MKPVANKAARYDAITFGITTQYDVKAGLEDEATTGSDDEYDFRFLPSAGLTLTL
jgi:hypothetical protein